MEHTQCHVVTAVYKVPIRRHVAFGRTWSSSVKLDLFSRLLFVAVFSLRALLLSPYVTVVKGRRKIALTAFGQMVSELLGDESDDTSPNEEAFLRCPPIFQIKYQNNEIVKVVRQ